MYDAVLVKDLSITRRMLICFSLNYYLPQNDLSYSVFLMTISVIIISLLMQLGLAHSEYINQ